MSGGERFFFLEDISVIQRTFNRRKEETLSVFFFVTALNHDTDRGWSMDEKLKSRQQKVMTKTQL